MLAYGVLGSMFMPFLAITLLLLLNSTRVPPEWRSGPVSNTGLVIAALLFAIVSGSEMVGLLRGLLDGLGSGLSASRHTDHHLRQFGA